MFGDKVFGGHPFKYPTPAEVPEDTGCRTFRIPSDPAWFALIMGALLPLTDPANFQQFEGGISRETAAEIFFDLIQETYDNAEDGCESCVLPTGQPVFRVGSDGALQQLIDTSWSPPTGDATIPPLPPREGGTDDDKRCLASANAAHALEVLYENISDSWAAGKTEAEAITELLLAIAAAILAPIALIAAALIALAALVFKVLYEVVEFVGADYWTVSFTKQIQCALYDCSAVDGEGVVTFDFDCFNRYLASGTDITTNVFNVVLFGQIQYLLMWIGADGLNFAGAATAITDADCSTCGCEGEWVATWATWAGWAFGAFGEYYADVLQGTAREYVTPIGYTWQNSGTVTLDNTYLIDWVEIDMDSDGVAISVALFDDLGNLLASDNPAVGRHTTRLEITEEYISDHVNVQTQATNTVDSFKATWVYSIRVHYRCE